MKKVLTLSVVALFAGVLCAGCGEGRQSAGMEQDIVPFFPQHAYSGICR